MTSRAARETLFWTVVVIGAIVAFQVIPKDMPPMLMMGLQLALLLGVLAFARHHRKSQGQ
jgi:hypothetical protein